MDFEDVKLILMISIPLLSVLWGGLTYWVRKLDDRIYTMSASTPTFKDLEQIEARLERAMEKMEARNTMAFGEIIKELKELGDKQDKILERQFSWRRSAADGGIS